MSHAWHDVRFAVRQMRRQPGVAVAIVVTLTLAIAVNTALFSILRAVVFGAVPVHDPDTLAAVYTIDHNNPGHMPVSDVTAFDLRDALTQEGDPAPQLAFFAVRSMLVESDGERSPTAATLVTANYFDVLGVRPALGTTFSTTDDAGCGALEAVVSHGFWRWRLGADPHVIGRTVIVEGITFTIVGVGPEGFAGTNLFDSALFLPYASHAEILPTVPWFGMRRFLAFEVLVRMPPELGIDALDDRVGRIADAIAAANPEQVGSRRLRAVPYAHAILGPDQRQTVLLAAALGGTMVGFVLLVACANAANLLLARAATRHGELALRGVLGATPWRLLRQSLVESLVLAASAGLLAIAITPLVRDGLWRLRPPLLEMATLQPAIDGEALAFTALTAVVTGLVFGAAPALRAARIDVTTPLRLHASAGAAAHRRVRSALVVVQVALSFVALVAPGLLLRSVGNAGAVDPGFAVDELAVLDLDASPEVAETLVAALGEQPEVLGATVATQLPFGHNEFRRTIDATEPTRPDAPSGLLVRTAAVDAGYFEVMGIEHRRGRAFSDDDDRGRPMVAIVNDTFAAAYWGQDDPIGRTIRFAGVSEPIEIVGVVATSKTGTLTEPPTPFLYVALSQWPQRELQLVVRSSSPRDAVERVMHRLAGRDDVTVSRPRPFTEDRDAALGPMRSAATLLLLSGGLAVALATLGIHAVMNHAVRQRTREIGVRMALGADARHVLRQFLGEALGLVLIGDAIGIAGGLVLQTALGDHLFDVPLGDAATFFGVAAIVATCALMATWLPARAATRIDPARAIHHG